eukprot:CAMPEP_0114429662 /NCGR_PEP_ID=MMETSP0103-20121206/9613_1 /TAXON_ID=37642 ORGANISM="Paraphysomonas imperforata, Strain PA2" /NCGR_SAMPLE_ID=MMETSP0103 /ASSEMBLY_ACC=CAM_ASM_000201 /LENGTH=669 /DNA_ID=CAMNT_0001599029 /DNA_START=116 /DNA_END=2126 /DNA_ORIENTATION=+
MRAYENVALYCVLPDSERKKQFKAHKKRMKNIKGTLGPKDLNFEPVISPRNNQDSSKITSLRYGKEAVVARNNLVLAKRIFEIMEGPGIISDLMDSDNNTHHPGTINFPHRLAEAKRIHNENLIIASRLDAVQPTYYDKSAVSAVRKSSPSKRKRPPHYQRKKASDRVSEPGTQHSLVHGTQSEDKPPKSKNVLLEYSKVQKGRVLDVAVIKEPFRDSYSIFGIDIDNGQRYELKLASEEVSNILEGDILVTNVDNVEVWMALISKVELLPVEAFSKTPLPNASHMTKSETKKPSKPTSLNSSKNQQNNPRINKMRKKEVKSAATDESAGSSSAIHGTDDVDDMSLTTGGEENQANDNDHMALGDVGLGDDEEDSTRGYTLDEYYENNAALSPLPSQTGFVTSAPSGRRNLDRSGNDTASPTSTSGNNRDDDIEKDVTGMAAMSVSYILDTAVKNILINCKKSEKKQARPEAGDKAPPSKKERESNPYTSTKVTTRSNSITYTSTRPDKGTKKDQDADHKQDLTTPAKRLSPVKEPQQPTDAPPPEGSRRPVPKHRPGGSSGGPRKKASIAKSDPDSGRKQSRAVENTATSSRKQSSAVDNSGLNNSRKKSSAVTDPAARRVSSFRKVDPITNIMGLCPKVADLAVKSALKRCGDIVELFNLELPESSM